MSLSHNPEIACETLHGVANSKRMPDVIADPSRRAFNHEHAAHCEVGHGGTGGGLLRAEATSTRQIYPWGAMRQGRLTVEVAGFARRRPWQVPLNALNASYARALANLVSRVGRTGGHHFTQVHHKMLRPKNGLAL
jgi:hypothetical protein